MTTGAVALIIVASGVIGGALGYLLKMTYGQKGTTPPPVYFQMREKADRMAHRETALPPDSDTTVLLNAGCDRPESEY